MADNCQLESRADGSEFLRGRAGGAWVVYIGMAPFGQFQIGALASLFGVRAALDVNGVALMALGVAATLLAVPRLRRL